MVEETQYVRLMEALSGQCGLRRLQHPLRQARPFTGRDGAFPFPPLFLQPLFSVINQYCGEANQHIEETKATATETTQEDKGLSKIHPNEKKSQWSIAFIWVGTMICIPMLMVGSIFGGTLTMGSIFRATLIGFAICCPLMVMVGAIMAIGSGSYDVISMLAGLGLPVIAMLVLVLAI